MNTPAEKPGLAAWQALQRRLRDAGHRRLVLLEGSRQASLDWLAALLPELPVTPGVWVGSDSALSIEGIESIPAKQARRWLGQELNCVIWDGWQGNPPDGLAALAGTLAAGGLMFWLMPPLPEWVGFADPDYRRVGLESANAHPFAARLARVIAGDSSVIRLNLGIDPHALPPDLRPNLYSHPHPVDKPFQVGATAEQSKLVEDIVRVGLGRRRRPLVITADRGRGKSAALGMAAARLVDEGRQQVLVTANEHGAIETLMRHAGPAFNSGKVSFFLVEELLAQRPQGELVVVDEAASIPPHRLRQILLGWPRVVFATTVHGYEGAGRGFSVRFREVLDKETPHWKQASLQAPIRWSDTDPLEPLISRLFLLNADAPAISEQHVISEQEVPRQADSQKLAEPGDSLTIERWCPASASDAELDPGFGLLVDAHYRTTPGDLRQWMDDPAAVSWRAMRNGVCVGVLWATVEGGLDQALANEVMLGRRRLRGHLLPQSLAFHSGFARAAELRLLRVVRVAVHADVRRQGIGRALIDAARDYARGQASNQASDEAHSQGLDALGTSFGGTPELLTFWQRAGLMPVRLGLSREASSGELPLQMLCGVSKAGRQLTDDLRGRLSEHWLTLVPRLWPDLDARLLLQISASLPAPQALSENDRRDLNSFAFGHRGFDLTLPVLQSLSLTPGVAKALIDDQEAAVSELWARAVLQGWDWQRLRYAGVCLGREEGESRLRTVVKSLTQNLLQNRPDL